MTLYEEGRFQLLDPVAKYLPAFAKTKVYTGDKSGGKEVDPVRPMTIKDLLTHTSGLTYHFLEDSPVCGMYREASILEADLTLQELVDELARVPLAFQPGTKWHYSMGIDVAAHLIEILSDQPLTDFLKSRLFEPLGMEDTDFYVPTEKEDRLASMYGLPDIVLSDSTFSKLFEAWENDNIKKIDVIENYKPACPNGYCRGGHGLYSTSWDYLQFAQMLLNGGTLNGSRILGRKIVEFMHTNHLPADLLPFEIGGMPSLGYGFGLGSRVLMNVAESGFPGSVGEYGWSGAAKTHYWVDPQEALIGVFMTQFMVGMDIPEKDFQVIAYAAIMD
jgi:CubicO group peptidase (beta-lactamase class C family)